MGRLRYIVSSGLAPRTTVTHIQMRAVLCASMVTSAVGIAAPAIGFGEAAQQSLRQRFLNLSDQTFSLTLVHNVFNRCGTVLGICARCEPPRPSSGR